MCCFFLHSLPYIGRLSLDWAALLGAILLLILSDRRDIATILERVEWSTLLFFAVLFILMESLAKLSLIEWIGRQTENVILLVGEEFRLTVAVLIVLWVSAIASAFVDNIPLTTMMIRITISLTEKAVLNLPMQPLIWALSFGASLGGKQMDFYRVLSSLLFHDTAIIYYILHSDLAFVFISIFSFLFKEMAH